MALRRILLVALGALVAGCGGGSGGKVQTVTVTGTEMRFTPAELTLAPGRYRFHFVNAGTTYHDLGIYPGGGGRSLSTREAAAGQSIDLDVVKLATGTYRMECHEPGHLPAGMEGTIAVRNPS